MSMIYNNPCLLDLLHIKYLSVCRCCVQSRSLPNNSGHISRTVCGHLGYVRFVCVLSRWSAIGDVTSSSIKYVMLCLVDSTIRCLLLMCGRVLLHRKWREYNQCLCNWIGSSHNFTTQLKKTFSWILCLEDDSTHDYTFHYNRCHSKCDQWIPNVGIHENDISVVITS